MHTQKVNAVLEGIQKYSATIWLEFMFMVQSHLIVLIGRGAILIIL